MKSLIAIIACLFSINAFCCSTKSRIYANKLSISGVLNKLIDSEQYKDFEIKNISKINFEYSVKIMNSQSNICMELILQPYVSGSCDTNANMMSEKEIDFSACQ